MELQLLHDCRLTSFPTSHFEGVNESSVIIITGAISDNGKAGKRNSDSGNFLVRPKLGGPSYTQHMLSIYKQVAKVDLSNFISARVPVSSNLNLALWRDIPTIPEQHRVGDFLTYGFPTGFECEVPIPSFQIMYLPMTILRM